MAFICSGNICRSPYAEAKLRQRATDAGGSAPLEVSSAGTLGLCDVPVHHFILAIAEKKGLPLTERASRGVTDDLLSRCDVILGLSRDHVTWVRNQFPRHAPRVYLLGSFPRHDLDGDEVEDPIGRDRSVFQRVCDHIDALIDRILPEITRRIELMQAHRDSDPSPSP